MKRYPSIPCAADVPELFDSGHLWLLEKVDGAHLRFQLRPSGAIRFGDRDRVFADPEAIPVPYRHAVRHVRENLDREALRTAVEDVTDVVFFGEAMHRHAIDYDWERTPSFLGFDVWSAETETFYPPDTVERIFDRLGLHPVNAFEKERNVRDFDPDAYAIPQSAWYDGPAAGVVVRNKQGGRAKLRHPDARDGEPTPAASADELAAEYATSERFERIAAELAARDKQVTFDALYERAFEEIVREAHTTLSEETVDTQAFRSRVAALTREYLADERDPA